MLSLSHVVMSYALPVQLRVLVPTVENSISGNAYRPLDVLATRAGITVEVRKVEYDARPQVSRMKLDQSMMRLGSALPAHFDQLALNSNHLAPRLLRAACT